MNIFIMCSQCIYKPYAVIKKKYVLPKNLKIVALFFILYFLLKLNIKKSVNFLNKEAGVVLSLTLTPQIFGKIK